MKQVTIVLLAICAFYMINEADAHFWGGRWGGLGGWGGRGWGWGSWYRPYYGYYGWSNRYYPYYYGYWKRATEGPKRLECTFSEVKGLLSCAGLSSNVECETIRVFDSSLTHPFTFYAVGLRPEGVSKEPLQVHYELYPEMLESKGWLNSTFNDAETMKSYTYALYYNPEFSFSGFRVKDLDCWKNMTVLLDGVVSNETISIPMSGNSEQKVEIKTIGGILLG